MILPDPLSAQRKKPFLPSSHSSNTYGSISGSIRARRRSSSPTCTNPLPPGKGAARYFALNFGFLAWGRNAWETVLVTPFVSFMNSSITGSPAIFTPMQHGSLDAMISPSGDTMLISSMSRAFAMPDIVSIERLDGEPM